MNMKQNRKDTFRPLQFLVILIYFGIIFTFVSMLKKIAITQIPKSNDNLHRPPSFSSLFFSHPVKNTYFFIILMVTEYSNGIKSNYVGIFLFLSLHCQSAEYFCKVTKVSTSILIFKIKRTRQLSELGQNKPLNLSDISWC